MDMFVDIVKYFFSVSVITAGIVYLSKHIVDHYFDKDIERFKNELEKAAIEHQIRYAKLHEERAQAIKEIYKRIAIAERLTKEYVTPVDFGGLAPIEERRKKAADSANEYLNYYNENKIFLSDEICCLLDDINKCILDAWYKFNSKDRRGGDNDFWEEAWNAITKKLPEARAKLEKAFRKIIGVDG